MLGAPKVKTVRGFSDFGYSYVYVIFEDGTDIYWARSRTMEYLSGVLPRLPQGVRTELGPDATGVGWVFQYALVDTTGQHGLDELRTYQDWYLRYYLKSIPGVAEVAPLGGFVRQYQVQVDPNRLRAFNMPMSKVVDAVRGGNNDVGGRLVEMTGAEYMVRGRGYAKSTTDVGDIVLARNVNGVPVRVRDVGQVTLGPDLRRGVADLDGKGDTVAGSSNIMSLGGIAIAVGAMVDAAIVVVEQTHKKLELWDRTGRKEDYHRVVVDAVKEVGGPSFFALLVIAVSFLPVLTLEAQEGRLFRPLAYTKTFSMIVAAILAITLDPAMRLLFTHMKNYAFRPRWLARVAT